MYQGEEPGSANGPSEIGPMGLRRGLQGMVVDREGAAGSDREGGAFACRGKPLPSGWPHLDSSQEVLAPFLVCASPAEFVAMQRGVDMPALVESLTDWDAVRLGALGPMDAPASAVLSRKRAAFLVTSVEKYGVPYSEVLALFVLHSAFDDELREVVQRLARDKQLGETLGGMPVVREELKRRSLALEGFPERGEQASDVLRGLGRAGRDMLSSSPASVEAQYSDLMTVKRSQLPPPYQDALDEVRKALSARHYAPGSVAAGSFDSLTFGVPVGFYHLVAGTGHGAYSLAQGKYEQATRELAPAALAVAVYAGGKGARALVESRGGLRGLQIPTLDVGAMKALMARLEEQLGVTAARDLLRYVQATREGALLAAEWGEAGLLALYEARGNPAKAQAVLAEASRESGRGPAVRGGATRSGAGGSSPRGIPSVDVPIRNAHLAGKKHPVTGVPFDMEGYPDFRAAGVVKAEVKIAYTGSRAGDFAAANRAAGLQATPKGMTWHHHQDRTTMQLVPTDVHARTGHTGGFAGGQ
ncbi:HNH endonuclease [Myxococcus xanthus]|nr:HNH endonuclease [Myxococcus xanthus]